MSDVFPTAKPKSANIPRPAQVMWAPRIHFTILATLYNFVSMYVISNHKESWQKTNELRFSKAKTPGATVVVWTTSTTTRLSRLSSSVTTTLGVCRVTSLSVDTCNEKPALPELQRSDIPMSKSSFTPLNTARLHEPINYQLIISPLTLSWDTNGEDGVGNYYHYYY